MNLVKDIINTTVIDKNGEVFDVVSTIERNPVLLTIICLSDGRKFQIKGSYINNYFIYEPQITKMIEEELAKMANAPAHKVVVSSAVSNENTDYEIGDDSISLFRNENYFLSNMYNCTVTYNGLTYNSSEAAFQAQKDPERSSEFVNIGPKNAKALGKTVNMRPDWNSIRVNVMEEIIRAKFTQNDDLKDKLLATGDKQLVEGNAWNDRFWGVCKGKGENHLGEILMKIRDELKI